VSIFEHTTMDPSPPELPPAAVRVAPPADVLEVSFEHITLDATTSTAPAEPQPATARVTESADVMEFVFEHCGLRGLDTLKRVCKLWHNLARALPTRWATAYIAGHLGDVSTHQRLMDAQFAVCLPDAGALIVADSWNNRIQFFHSNDAGLTRATPHDPR